MIWDSYHWKIELRKAADSITRLSKDIDGPRDKNDFLMERSVLVGFYSIRKLTESMKVTNQCAVTKVPLIAYPSRFGASQVIHHMNWHKVNEFYDLDNHIKTSMKLITICNLFIHSFIFFPLLGLNRHTIAILFTSDRTKYKYLYHITTDEISYLFKRVADDYPNKLRMVKIEFVTEELRMHLKNNDIIPIEQDGILYIYE